MIGKFLGSLLAALAPAQPATPAATVPVNYSSDSNWLCLPGRKDACSTPLPTTALNANGYGSTGSSPVAKDAPVDCFYVYPTVSRDPGLNSDLNVSASEEKYAAEAQFARFAGVCRPFVPVYRQMTLGAIAAMAAGVDIAPAARLAYGDVASAWRDYVANRNHGRPFVLVGHSQGSALLQQLIAREIEGKPIARRMKLAILPGYNLLVPQGKLVGGTLKSTPLCNRPEETGCVIAFSSFRQGDVPQPGAMFGYAAQPGMTVACVNPARPGSRNWEVLDSYWYTRATNPVPGGPIVWSTQGPPPTPFVRTPGLVSARCVNDGPRGYLEVRTNAGPNDKRTARIGGEVGAGGLFLPGWGMHLADMSVGQGDLIREVGELSKTK